LKVVDSFTWLVNSVFHPACPLLAELRQLRRPSCKPCCGDHGCTQECTTLWCAGRDLTALADDIGIDLHEQRRCRGTCQKSTLFGTEYLHQARHREAGRLYRALTTNDDQPGGLTPLLLCLGGRCSDSVQHRACPKSNPLQHSAIKVRTSRSQAEPPDRTCALPQ
jgi:hypothetical protein